MGRRGEDDHERRGRREGGAGRDRFDRGADRPGQESRVERVEEYRQGVDARLDRMEERLDRLEQRLERHLQSGDA